MADQVIGDKLWRLVDAGKASMVRDNAPWGDGDDITETVVETPTEDETNWYNSLVLALEEISTGDWLFGGGPFIEVIQGDPNRLDMGLDYLNYRGVKVTGTYKGVAQPIFYLER